MIMARIVIVVEVDESKLTAEQQLIAEKSNEDLSVEHPVSKGCDDIRDRASNMKDYFNYLFKGIDAVTVMVE
ncbi:hypothetical protein KAR91_62440 [Candidatus Pacearchaeota archaeon]|nr:hypothetical protein [Candidatus Pacearchaeota archaeon]